MTMLMVVIMGMLAFVFVFMFVCHFFSYFLNFEFLLALGDFFHNLPLLIGDFHDRQPGVAH